ncbi:MAG TPA: hypothetical protein VEJ67_03585 [Candidatus Cybelea sp.]|nr:hypothetical protein [Candidatus Cybelea sp.]
MSESDMAIAPGGPLGSAPAIIAAPAGSNARTIEWLKLVFSFPAMLGVALVGRAFYDLRTFFVDPDLWWHIKSGQAILATHNWPTTDPYSFTVGGQPWVAYEWLGEVVTAWLYRRGGLAGLETFLVVFGFLIVIALYILATMRSGNSKAAFVVVGLATSLVTGQLTLRPQMFGYLFLILTLIILELFRQGKRKAIWLLPVMMLVWVNTHGSFIIGLGVILVYWISGLLEFRLGRIEARRWRLEERQQISFAFLLSLAVVAITPYGTQLAAIPFRYAFSLPLNAANILEWRPMPFDLLGGKIFLGLMLGFFLAQFLVDLVWRLEDVALVFASAALSCIHLRFLLVFVPFFVPLLARAFACWLRPYSRAKDKYVLNAILMTVIVGGVIHYFPSIAFIEEKVAERFPVHALQYLEQHQVAGPMLNEYGFGGYLVFSGYKTFIDGRGDVYETGGVLSDYVQLTELKPGGLDVLRRYRIQSCLLGRDDDLSVVLAALPGWQKVYSDHTSVLFIRTDSTQSAPQR